MAPLEASHIPSHPPLKPVCPVRKTRLPCQEKVGSSIALRIPGEGVSHVSSGAQLAEVEMWPTPDALPLYFDLKISLLKGLGMGYCGGIGRNSKGPARWPGLFSTVSILASWA